MRPHPTRLIVVDPSETRARASMAALEAAGLVPRWARVDDAAALALLLDEGTPWDAVVCELGGGIGGRGDDADEGEAVGDGDGDGDGASIEGDDARPPGLAALALLQSRDVDLPAVGLVERLDADTALAVMRAGARDIVRRAEIGRLASVLRHEIAQATGRARVRTTRRDLEAARDRYVDLFESAPVGYLTLSADGTLLQVNRTGVELLGQTPAELSGAPFGRFVLRADAERWQQHLSRVFADDERRRIELRLRAAHGAIVHVQADCVRVTEAGCPPRVRIALTDVSDRKEAEAGLRRFEARLREVQKMESLGTLAGGIAHDFNNVLAAILGNVELARDDLPAEHRAVVSLDEIRKASLRARDLVSQILMFSRREPQELVTQPLQQVMEETQRLLRATLPARVDLEFDFWPDSVWVHSDATQLQQVLMNLCTNAWHALKAGAGHIRVALRPVALGVPDARRLGLDGPGDYARLEVSDDGVGIDAATQARIFEPFFTTKPAGQGTGLGLSVVHGIVVAHHGAIEVESQPGHGATFRLWFPIAQAPSLVEAPRADALPARVGDGEHVVYIDDDETMAVMVERLLARAGYRVSCYTDPARALVDLCDARLDADCVVTDFNMPELTGLDVARELHRARPGMPVIVSTGYLSDELRSDARRLGVRALLQKQNTVQELADLVDHVMAGSVAG